MHQDVEKLLNAAKEKGSITEKQRNLIIAKAQQLNDDTTEIEFILDDIPIKNSVEAHTLPPIPALEKTKSNKQGEVKKCPLCGAIVQGFQAKCPECGYTFEDVKANQSVSKLLELLVAADNQKTDIWDASPIDKKKTIIRNFPIPNTKADLIDFLVFLEPKLLVSEDDFRTDYKIKYDECVAKAKMLFPDDEDFKSLIGKNNNARIFWKRITRSWWFWTIIVGLILSIIGNLIGE